MDALEGKMNNVQIVVIKGTDHMTAFGNEQFAKELKTFLAAHSAASTTGANGVKAVPGKNVPSRQRVD